MNTKNLKKYSDWLKEGHVTQEQFDMRMFRQNEKGDELDFNSKADCGTVGCLLGWSPFCFEPTEDDYCKCMTCLIWFTYCKRIFDLDICNKWHFLFSEFWGNYDNTLQGAIKRIDFLVKNPDAFDGCDDFDDIVKCYEEMK